MFYMHLHRSLIRSGEQRTPDDINQIILIRQITSIILLDMAAFTDAYFSTTSTRIDSSQYSVSVFKKLISTR
jgi:hypothetical protein